MLPTTTCRLCIKADPRIEGKANYTIASPRFNIGDTFTGKLYFTLDLDFTYFGEESRFYFWVTYLPHSVLVCNISREGAVKKIKPNVEEGGIEIFLKLNNSHAYQSAGYVQSYIPREICKTCNSPCRKYPELAMMWLAPGEKKLGYMYAGAAKFLFPFVKQGEVLSTEIRNFPMELHILGYENFAPHQEPKQIVLGNVFMDVNSVVNTPDGFDVMKTFVKNKLDLTLWEKGEDDKKRRWSHKYRMRNDVLIQQPYIATWFGIVPRAYYYINMVSDVNTVTPEWLAAQILFSLKISEEKIPDPTTLSSQKWNLYMHYIIRAFTLFVTRFNYIKDALYKDDDDFDAFECYSGPILIGTGSYDCEDGSWLLLCIFRHLQALDLNKVDARIKNVLTFAKYLVDRYVPCSALVTVTNPCLYKRSEEDIRKEEFGYHQTCLLIPKQSLGITDEVTRPGLTVLYAESTCLVYSNPLEYVFPTADDFVDMITDISLGRDMLALPIERNTPFNNPLFKTLLALYSDFYIYGGEYEGITEIQLHKNKSEGGAFIEDIHNLKKLLPTSEKFGFKNEEEKEAIKCIRDMESTSPMFEIGMDLTLFLEKLNEIPERKPDINKKDGKEGLKESIFFPVITNESIPGRFSFPYLGWMLTNQNIAPVEKDFYISI